MKPLTPSIGSGHCLVCHDLRSMRHSSKDKWRGTRTVLVWRPKAVVASAAVGAGLVVKEVLVVVVAVAVVVVVADNTRRPVVQPLRRAS